MEIVKNLTIQSLPKLELNVNKKKLKKIKFRVDKSPIICYTLTMEKLLADRPTGRYWKGW